MQNHVYIKDLAGHVGREVVLRGWVYNTRFSGKIGFVIIRDGTGLCQCVVEKKAAAGAADPAAGVADATASAANAATDAAASGTGGADTPASDDTFAVAKGLTQESSVEVTGLVRADERSVGGHELQVTGVKLVQQAVDYPITPKAHGIDYLMKHRHLWFRSQRQHAILRIRATVVDAIRRYFNDNGYVLIDTPIFSPAIGESASTLFAVDYFGENVYLAQTGQLHVEAACMAHGKVYCFGPTFRAEKSKTRRHLTEFWMVEPEIAYAYLDDVIAVAEDFVYSVTRRVLADHRADLETLGRDVAALEAIRKPFYRMTYTEAADILRGPKARQLLERDLADKKAAVAELSARIEQLEEQAKTAKKKWQQEKAAQEVQTARMERADLQEQVDNIPHHIELAANFEWGSDLGGSDETVISRLHDRPVFVTHYPREVKAFYMRVDRQNRKLVENFDLLAPEGVGEIIGGSAREEDYDILLSRIKEEGLPLDAYEWYLDLRRYGSVPHGGFGLGLERTIAWLCGLQHIRETIPFPRMMGKIYP